MAAVQTFSLYLLKDALPNDHLVLTESAQERIRVGQGVIRLALAPQPPGQVIEDDDVAADGAEDDDPAWSGYVFSNIGRPVQWRRSLAAVFAGVPALSSTSHSALIFFTAAGRRFVIAYGHAWQLLNERHVVDDFGLMVVVNSLGDESVKRVDRNHLGDALRGVSQAASHRDIDAFGIDEALELIRSIQGKVGDDFAESLSGATALQLSCDRTIEDLPDLAVEALRRYHLLDYQATRFHIIDVIKPINDIAIKERLDGLAAADIAGGGVRFELAAPDWPDRDVVSFGFRGLGNLPRQKQILMADYQAALGNALAGLTSDDIVDRHEIVVDYDNNTPPKGWTVKKCLLGTIESEGGLYAACEGQWYRIDETFKRSVDQSFADAYDPTWPVPFVPVVTQVAGRRGKPKPGLESELEYNRRYADRHGLICLDQEIIIVPTMQNGRFEACDLLDVAGRRFIHVKKGRQSSVLSHFFKQGRNSIKILKRYPEAAQLLVDRVRQISGDASADALRVELLGGFENWIVEFNIIDAAAADGSFSIPFFSRITLRDERRAMSEWGFRSVIRLIDTNHRGAAMP